MIGWWRFPHSRLLVFFFSAWDQFSALPKEGSKQARCFKEFQAGNWGGRREQGRGSPVWSFVMGRLGNTLRLDAERGQLQEPQTRQTTMWAEQHSKVSGFYSMQKSHHLQSHEFLLDTSCDDRRPTFSQMYLFFEVKLTDWTLISYCRHRGC